MAQLLPAKHEAFKARCHEAGQPNPTPLILKYGAGTITACTRIFTANTSSRFKSRFLLSKPGEEFKGGEFTLETAVGVLVLAAGLIGFIGSSAAGVIWAVLGSSAVAARVAQWRIRLRHRTAKTIEELPT